jgi:RNA polymerase sigma-70 factor (ECF subfamily)
MLTAVTSLLERLRARVPGALAGADERAVEALLEETVRRCRERWPDLRGADEALLEALARAVPSDLAILESLSLDDLLLAGACKRGDRAALAELDRRLSSLVPRWLKGDARAQSDEVQQILRQKLLTGEDPRIASYSGRRPLEAWLRVAAIRGAINLREAHKGGESDGLEQLSAGFDPELDAMKVLDGHAFREVLREALQGLTAAQRTLLKLHYLKGLSLEKLAVMEKVHRATVARRLAETRSAALERVRAIVAERLRLSEKDGESLLRMLRSRLGENLSRALESASAGVPDP